MTILPNCSKKKPQQPSSSGEIEPGEASSSGNHHSNHSQHQMPNIGSIPSHISQSGDGGSCGNFYLNSQSSPPCWPSGSASSSLREEKRATHSSPVHYEENHESGSSHSKRRYRASPLRSVRPKLREHRGSASPPYPSTSGIWNVSSSVNQHNIPHQLNHSLALPASNLSTRSPLSPQAGPSCSQNGNNSDEDPTAYNSGDEYESFVGWNLTKEQWEEKERWFEKKMKKNRRIIRKTMEDGACLFRAISDQVFGDEEMHAVVRQQCMDYIQRNEDMFAPFVSECFQTYVERKRKVDCHGNHIEIAAMSELYNRVIEVYCYGTDPINIFQGSMQTDNAPIRITYHKGTHYNSLVDPFSATVGVGLGLPGLQPGLADKNLMGEATRVSEKFHIEQTMLEDKIRATDFEATGDAIEEQVAQQSYLDWVRENELQNRSKVSVSNSGGGSKSPKERRSPHHQSVSGGSEGSSRSSPRQTSSPKGRSSPSRAKVSDGPADLAMDPAIPGPSRDPMPSSSHAVHFGGFRVNESASFLNVLSPNMFGLNEYSNEEADILARVLAQSQQEYFESLKNRKEESAESQQSPSPRPCTSGTVADAGNSS